MKKYLLVVILVIFSLSSCNDNWDDYYFGKASQQSEEVLSITLEEFFQKNPEYSQYYEMLNKTGLSKELNQDQQLTLWVADNESMTASGIEEDDTLRMEYHINYLPFIRSDLKQGLRIRSLNGIYLQISQETKDIYVNSSKILKSYRLKNGVVHHISSLLKSKVNMYDYLMELGDDYSIIRDSIFKDNIRVFDKVNSTPIGVDKTGNTLYDSVFYVDNPLFIKAKFNSEFEQFTAFVPDNRVMTDCFMKLNDQYKKMGKTAALADTVLAMKWIKEAMFYKGLVTDFSKKDIKSAFDRVWRTSVQKVNMATPVELSNGMLYNMTELKVPNNVIITRIKSFVEYWQYQDKTYPDPEDLYVIKGLIKPTIDKPNPKPSSVAKDATPRPEIMPNYVIFEMDGQADVDEEFSVSFPPLEKYEEGGKTKVKVMQVPTGEYNLYMGFLSSDHPYVNIYFNDKLVSKNIDVFSSTPWNYDRVTETSLDLDPVNGTKKWDGLGGLVGVVNIEGDGMSSFRIKVEFAALKSVGTAKRMRLYHWALKPSADNY